MRGIVRPYAAAAFSFAYAKNALTRERDILGEWSASLTLMASAAAEVMRQTQGRGLLGDEELAGAVRELSGEKDRSRLNFVDILAENRRLRLLPEIAEMFEELRRESAGVVEVRVECARMPDEQTKAQLEKIMAKWTGAKVRAHFEENADLLGGVRAYARDDVLDASIRGRLNNMAALVGAAKEETQQ
ncbi:MAG: ATP synthase F1 subunit delta [Gammaproteobacteria bacterium]